MGGEDLPGPAFLEWMGWCMEPEFLFGDDTLPERRHFPEFRAPIRFVQVADDPWGTPAAVGHMAQHFSASVDRSIWRATPTEAGVGYAASRACSKVSLSRRSTSPGATAALK